MSSYARACHPGSGFGPRVEAIDCPPLDHEGVREPYGRGYAEALRNRAGHRGGLVWDWQAGIRKASKTELGDGRTCMWYDLEDDDSPMTPCGAVASYTIGQRHPRFYCFRHARKYRRILAKLAKRDKKAMAERDRTEQICIDCGATFERRVKNGQRPKRCPSCQLIVTKARKRRNWFARKARMAEERERNALGCGTREVSWAHGRETT